MLKSASHDRASDPLWIGIAAIAAITIYRVVALGFSTAELFVDEAQYWQWGQELDWGYYSKPPLIGWVLRAVTELAHSDATFWVRLPGSLFHAAAALMMLGAARRIMAPAAANATAIAYATLPAVAAGSLLVSTDSMLLPFFAAALWLWLELTARRSALAAAALGLCLGLGMLAKYAAVYFLLGAGLGALLVPQSRIALRDAGIALAVFALVIAPNVVWNLQNDLMTLSHTADNVDWVRQPGVHLHVGKAAEFLLSQFGVMGPVFFGAYLWLAPRALRRADWQPRWLVWMSAPILLLVAAQALLSQAYANWAVTACLALLLLVVPVLWTRARRLFWIALALDLAVSLLIPFAATQATRWHAGDRLLMRRYVGQGAMSTRILDEAQAQGVTAVVSGNRHLLADLFHKAKGSGIAVYATPPQGRPPHFYAQRHPYPTGRTAPFLFATLSDTPPCPGPAPVAIWPPGPGIYAGQTLRLYRRDHDCWGAHLQ